jgi:hypothetical protein
MLHKNTHPHVACNVQDMLRSTHWKVLDHPPYSPVLTPCNFHVFGSLTKALKGCTFKLDEDVKAAVVPAATQGVLSKGHPSAGVSMGCLPQHPWGLFVTASNTSTNTIPKQLSLTNPCI